MSVRFVEDQRLDLLDPDDEPYEGVGFDPMEAVPMREATIDANDISNLRGDTSIGGAGNPDDNIPGGDSRGGSRDALIGGSGSPCAGWPAPTLSPANEVTSHHSVPTPAFGAANKMITPYESLPAWCSQASDDDNQGDGDRRCIRAGA